MELTPLHQYLMAGAALVFALGCVIWADSEWETAAPSARFWANAVQGVGLLTMLAALALAAQVLIVFY